MAFYELTETDEGLLLEVEGSPMALLRERHGTVDLVWQIRGPQQLDVFRATIEGLLQLLVHYDAKANTKKTS